MKNIAKALSHFQSLVPDIPKSANNTYFKSNYAPLDAILPTIKGPLKEAGLTFTQVPVGLNRLRTTIIHVESGEAIEGEFEMTPVKADPQGQGSILTYMRRYALVAMLGLNTDEDDDGNRAAHPAPAAAAKAKPGATHAAPPMKPAERPVKKTDWTAVVAARGEASPDPEADVKALNELM